MNISKKIIKKTITCTFLATLVFMLSGCAALNFRHEYDKGMRAYKEKNYEEAIISFNNALNYKPDSYSALCLLGASYAYKKDQKMAEKTFQDAIKLFPNLWNAYIFLADLKKSQHDYETAIEFYETAVTLESMGGKEKLYYRNLLKKIKEEQAAYIMDDPLVKQQSIEKFKNELVNSYTGEKETKNKTVEQKGEVMVGLDKKKWVKVLEQKDDKSKIIEFGLKGEDVKNYNWSQLVTIQYFILNENFKTTLDEYYRNHIGSIDAIAKNSNKQFDKKIIYQKKNEILYEWKFDEGKETEIARIVYTPKGIYHIHFAKKGIFTNEEKVKYIDLLKTASLR